MTMPGHTPPPPIGSGEWDRELMKLGIRRIDVDLLHDLGVAIARSEQSGTGTGDGDQGPAKLTGHDVGFTPSSIIRSLDALQSGEREGDGTWRQLCDDVLLTAEHWRSLERLRELAGEPFKSRSPECLALTCAAWVLFHQDHPGYGTMMYVRFACWPMREHDHLVDWFARQLAAMMIHGTPEIMESVDYSLGVDFFESSDDAVLIVPRLLPIVSPAHRDSILSSSGYLTWSAKRDFYFRVIDEPEHHGVLATALRDSFFSAFYGSIDACEGYQLFQRLESAHGDEPDWWDPVIRRDLIIGITQPIRAWVKSVIHLHHPATGGSDPDPPDALIALAIEPLRHEPSVFISGACPSWFPGSEIHIGDICHGVIRQVRHRLDYDQPFGPGPADLVSSDAIPEHTRHTAVAAPGSDESDHQPSTDDLATHVYPPHDAMPERVAGNIEWHSMVARDGFSPLDLVGHSIELWPPGIRELREELPGIPEPGSGSE